MLLWLDTFFDNFFSSTWLSDFNDTSLMFLWLEALLSSNNFLTAFITNLGFNSALLWLQFALNNMFSTGRFDDFSANLFMFSWFADFNNFSWCALWNLTDHLSTFNSLWKKFFTNLCRSWLWDLDNTLFVVNSLWNNLLYNFNLSWLRLILNCFLHFGWSLLSAFHYFCFSTGRFSHASFLWWFFRYTDRFADSTHYFCWWSALNCWSANNSLRWWANSFSWFADCNTGWH